MNNELKRGFSLVEVLVSLTVVSFGILGISALMSSSIKNSIEAKNQVVASNLAQEGIELVRNLSEGGSVIVAGDYRIDYRANSADIGFFASTASGYGLYTNNATGAYSHNSSAGNSATKFSRKIVTTMNAGNLEISSYVNWHGSDDFSSCNMANKCLMVKAVSVP